MGDRQWPYVRYGTGEHVLIAFHGYGQDASAFRHLGELLSNEYTIYAVELPFHDKGIQISENEALFDEYAARAMLDYLLSITQTKNVGLIGYSIGARIALALTSWFPDKIDELWLFAPDGLPVSNAYRLITGTWMGRKLFRSFVDSAEIYKGIIRLGCTIGLLSRKQSDFFLNEIKTSTQRLQLYKTWIYFRKSIPERNVLLRRSERGFLSTTCILGEFDAIISTPKVKKYLPLYLPDHQLIVIENGHNLLSQKAIEKLREVWTS